jgi:hypothetical protein
MERVGNEYYYDDGYRRQPTFDCLTTFPSGPSSAISSVSTLRTFPAWRESCPGPNGVVSAGIEPALIGDGQQIEDPTG